MRSVTGPPLGGMRMETNTFWITLLLPSPGVVLLISLVYTPKLWKMRSRFRPHGVLIVFFLSRSLPPRQSTVHPAAAWAAGRWRKGVKSSNAVLSVKPSSRMSEMTRVLNVRASAVL
eukprot:9467283-Pyramimonas_sp.AAC.1